MLCLLLVGHGYAQDEKPSEAVEAAAGPVPLPAAAAENQQQARQELQALLDQALPFVTNELHKKSTFYPFLAGMTPAGKVELVGVPSSLERPDPETAIKALRKAAKQLADKQRYRAIGLFIDYVAERKDTAIKQSGIRVELEHVYPDAITAFVPYFIHENNQISLLTPQFMPNQSNFFTSDN